MMTARFSVVRSKLESVPMLVERPSSSAIHSTELALAILRVSIGLILFLKHGSEKLFHFSHMLANFPDPFHIGRLPTLMIATASDGIASALLVIGLWTRSAAAFILANVLFAWGAVHHFDFFGGEALHGELCALYCIGVAVLLLAPRGRYSLDGLIQSRKVGKAHRRTIRV